MDLNNIRTIAILVIWIATATADRVYSGYHPLPHARDINVPANLPAPKYRSQPGGQYQADPTVTVYYPDNRPAQQQPPKAAGNQHPRALQQHRTVQQQKVYEPRGHGSIVPQPSYGQSKPVQHNSASPYGPPKSNRQPHVSPLPRPHVSADYQHETHRPVVLRRPSSGEHYGPAKRPEGEYEEKPAVDRPYNYDYTVSDQYSGANFAKQEDSDGKQTVGSYSVSLPDGRIQHVKYVADEYNGFNAVVTYEGEAYYPEEAPKKKEQHPPANYDNHGGQFDHQSVKVAAHLGSQYPGNHGRQVHGSQLQNSAVTSSKHVDPQEYGPPRNGGYHYQPLQHEASGSYRQERPGQQRSTKTQYQRLNYQLPPVY